MNKLIKFFIICAIALCIGIGFTIAGISADGIKGIDKVAENYDWFEGTPGQMQVETLDVSDYDSIDVTGNVDLVVIGDKYMSADADWPLPSKLEQIIRNKLPEEGMVFMGHGENVTAPEYTVENGVLKIEGETSDEGTVSMNFSNDDGIAKVVIFSGNRTFKDIRTSNNFCDVTLLGVKYENAYLSGSDNDIFMECAESGNLKIQGEFTDISLHGDFTGITDITTTDGDVEIETSVNRNEYGVDINAEDGDIELANGEVEIDDYPWTYKCDGGPNRLIIKNSCGDVKVFFGDTLY